MTKSQLRRALAPEDKTERRGAILRAATELLQRDSTASFSVEDIARRAGLAKGTVYLYFRSREDVLLAVHDAQMQEMFAAVEGALEEQPGADGARVRDAVLGFLQRRPEFFRLSSGCHGALERSVSPAAAHAHLELVAARLTAIGARIEQLYPGMRPGEGASLLKTCYAMMLGLWQLSASPLRRAGNARRGTPEPEALRINFEQQIGEALTDLWNSAVQRGQERST